MHASINNVTYHDGYTLHDIVTYEQKHNLANLEDNRDGHNHNLTNNYGVEGETDDLSIIDLREQQKRNLFATLMLSQGTPHILGGDELSRTQQGNNNAYCQDNSINWFKWELSERQEAFMHFCRYAIALRNQHPILQQMCFADDRFDNKQNILVADWYRRDGTHKTDIDWVNHEHHCFALHVVGELDEPNSKGHIAQEWLFCINSKAEDKEFNVPMLADSSHWQCMLDTALKDTRLYRKQKVKPIFAMSARSFRLYKKF